MQFLKYVVTVLVVFVLGVFAEHNFKLVEHVQKQCPHLKTQTEKAHEDCCVK